MKKKKQKNKKKKPQQTVKVPFVPVYHIPCYIPASAHVLPLRMPPFLLPFWIQVPSGFPALSILITYTTLLF